MCFLFTAASLSMARSSRRSPKRDRRSARPQTVFTRRNYILLLIGVALVVVGFAAMRIENELEGFISLYISPLLILGGYLEIIYAILWRPGETADAEAAAEG